MRKLALLLMLACAGLQPLASGSPLATALVVALHGHHHGHAVSVVADAGHFDLVLSHGGSDEPAHEGAPSLSEDGHVFHLPADGASSASARRAGPEPPAVPAVLVASAPLVAPPWRACPAAEPRARGSDPLDQLETVVLRL